VAIKGFERFIIEIILIGNLTPTESHGFECIGSFKHVGFECFKGFQSKHGFSFSLINYT
jgi:hypothetical protein